MSPREIPMLFQPGMVLGLLAGRKTQTRRLKFSGRRGDLIWVREAWRVGSHLDAVKPALLNEPSSVRSVCYQAGGDMAVTFHTDGVAGLFDQSDGGLPFNGRLRASMHLPKWGSRLTLRILGVRWEALHEISEADAMAEGIEHANVIIGAHGSTGHHCEITADRYWNGTEPDDFEGHESAVEAYEALWRHINGDASWDANPRVAVIDFEVMRECIVSVTSKAPAEAAA